MTRPMLDPIRGQLVNQARLAADAWGQQLDDISITACGLVGLNTISVTCQAHAQTSFDLLVAAVKVWDDMTADAEPWSIDVETGTYGVDWSEQWRYVADVLNRCIDDVLFAGLCSHLPLISVRRDGTSIVVSEVQS